MERSHVALTEINPKFWSRPSPFLTKTDFYRSISHKKLQKQNNEDFSIQLLYAWLILTNSNFPPYSFISMEKILVQPISLDPHTTLHGKPYFFSRRPEQMVFPKKKCAGIWSFLYYRERWYFFFPKIWSYTLDGKWKMIFLKKYTEIWHFLQTFWKYGLSKKSFLYWSFLYYLKRWFFFPENMIFFPWAESERRPFSGNTWKHDASPSEKNRKPDI